MCVFAASHQMASVIIHSVWSMPLSSFFARAKAQLSSFYLVSSAQIYFLLLSNINIRVLFLMQIKIFEINAKNKIEI